MRNCVRLVVHLGLGLGLLSLLGRTPDSEGRRVVRELMDDRTFQNVFHVEDWRAIILTDRGFRRIDYKTLTEREWIWLKQHVSPSDRNRLEQNVELQTLAALSGRERQIAALISRLGGTVSLGGEPDDVHIASATLFVPQSHDADPVDPPDGVDCDYVLELLVRDAPRLKSITFRSGRFSDSSLLALVRLKELEWLMVSWNRGAYWQPDGVVLASVCQMESLKHIMLSDVDLPGVTIKRILEKPELRSLCLYGITDAYGWRLLEDGKKGGMLILDGSVGVR